MTRPKAQTPDLRAYPAQGAPKSPAFPYSLSPRGTLRSEAEGLPLQNNQSGGVEIMTHMVPNYVKPRRELDNRRSKISIVECQYTMATEILRKFKMQVAFSAETFGE